MSMERITGQWEYTITTRKPGQEPEVYTVTCHTEQEAIRCAAMDAKDCCGIVSTPHLSTPISSPVFTLLETAKMTTQSNLLARLKIQVDRSGVGHCWKNAEPYDVPEDIMQEIECEILDGGKENCGCYVCSNGLHYRWTMD